MDSFTIHKCKYSTAVRRKYWKRYKDHESGCSKTTIGWSYGRKCHVSMDVDSCIIREWIVTKGNIHDSKVSHGLIDSVRNYTHILADSVHDTSLKKKEKYRILSFELNSNLMLSLIKKNYKYKIDRNDIIFWLKNARYRSYSDHGVIENIKSFFHNISILILLRVPVFFKRNLIKNYLESI